MRTILLRFSGLLILWTALIGGLHGQNPFDIKSKKGAKPTPPVILEKKTDSAENLNQQDSSLVSITDTLEDAIVDTPYLDTLQNFPDTVNVEDSLFLTDSLGLTDSITLDTVVEIPPTIEPEEPENNDLEKQKSNKTPWYAPWLNKGKPNQSSSSNQIFSTEKVINYVYIFLVLGLVAFLVNFDRSLVDGIFRTLRSNNELKILYREEYIKKRWLFILNYVIYILVMGYIVYKAIEYFFELEMPGLLLAGIMIVTLLVCIRHLVLEFLIWLTRGSYDFKIYNYQILIGNIILGYFLLPVMLLLGFGPKSFYEVLFIVTGCVIVLYYIYRQFRAFTLSSNTISMHTFQFFLYLCAFEIFPLLVAIKMASEGFNF